MTFIKCGVIGHPVSHSKSPIIHNHWIEKYGLSGKYEAIDIVPEELRDKIKSLLDSGYAGFNVTIPHKETIMALCDDMDDTAKKIGAVNTLYLKNGKVIGTNTDAFGFIENVKRCVPGIDISHRPSVVLGAGGAARAILSGLIGAGANKIILLNRTRDKAETLAHLNSDIITVRDWEVRNGVLKDAGLVVNTTALGMKGKDPLAIDLSALPNDAVVSDIVYAPLMTDLLKAAEARGNKVVTGIGMLLHQARPAFEKWFGVLPDIDAILEAKVLS